MDGDTVTLDEVNGWGQAAFVAALGSLFEQSPWIAAETWAMRPFASCDDLFRALLATVAGAESARQVALIQAHPDLVGRAALAGTLTRESTGEQQAAGLDPGRLTPDEVAAFQSLNADYAARFQFPFVICARDHHKDSILAAFRSRVRNDRETEVATALAEIGRICWYRLHDRVQCGLSADSGSR